MTQAVPNFARAFGKVAEANADLPALIALDEVLTYADLWRLVQQIAARMQADGVGPGSLVAVNLQDMRTSLGSLLATALLGSGFVIAGPVLAKAKTLQPTHFYRTSEMAGHPAVPFRVMDEDWLWTDDGVLPAPVDTDPDAPWLYLHTSGTTGTPKFIALTQRMVWDRSAATAGDFPYRQTTFASFFKSTARPFFARALAALMQACTIVEGTDIDRWQLAGVNFVCGSPMQVLQAFDSRSIDPPLDRLEVSGAPLPDGAGANFLRSFRRVLDVYGASETSKSFANELSLGPDGEVVRTGVTFDSEVQIVDERNQPCPPMTSGYVRVRNHYLVKGYVGNAEASARAFRDGWFYPGDIAEWGPRGELNVLGRDDSILNVAGYKINATLLEMLAKTVPGIADAVCLQNPVPRSVHPVLAFFEFEPSADRENACEQFMRIAAERLGHVFARKNLRAIDRIPKRPDGQPDRRACQALVLSYSQGQGEGE